MQIYAGGGANKMDTNWSKPKNDNSLENIENFKIKLEASRKYVNELLQNKTYGKLEIVDGLDKIRSETAQRIFELASKNGKVFRSQMVTDDINRVREIQKKQKISFEEAMQTLVKNCKYQSLERQFAENYFAIIKDVESLMQEYGDKLKVFPISALSAESLAKLDSNAVGLSNTIKLKMILDTFVPGYMNLDIVSLDYSVIPKKHYALSEQELLELAEDIKKNFGGKDAKIDNIFAKENKAGLTKLVEALKRNNYTFEDFANKFGLNYTRCYNLSSVPAAKHMVNNYYAKYFTYNMIKRNDQYLFTKLATIRKQLNMLSNEQLFESWGLDVNNMNRPNNILTDLDARILEEKLKEKLKLVCPDKNIPNNFTRLHRDIYFLVNKLAKRFGFENVDSYFEALGYNRCVSAERSTYSNLMCLSERDLIFYNFFDGATEESEISRIMQEKNIELAPVEEYAGFYTKLAYEKTDAIFYANGNIKRKDED